MRRHHLSVLGLAALCGTASPQSPSAAWRAQCEARLPPTSIEVIAVPAPVWMPQPSGPSSSSGTLVSTLTVLLMWEIALVENEDW